MTAVEWFWNEIAEVIPFTVDSTTAIKMYDKLQQAKEMEKEQKIEILKSLVYSVCIGDDVEDVEEWLKIH